MSRGFRRLSSDSRYRRFLEPMPKLPTSMVRYLTEIDHHDHEAMVALDERCNEGRVARYVRDRARPDAARLAVTVIDDWQGRGVGTLLTGGHQHARARGGHHHLHRALMLADNQEMMDLLEQLGTVQIVDRAAGTVEVEECPVPAIGVGTQLKRLLEIAATDTAMPSAVLWSFPSRARSGSARAANRKKM